MDQIPETLARKADERAMEIFEREVRFGRTFRECLGQVYMVAVKAALEGGLKEASAPERDNRRYRA